MTKAWIEKNLEAVRHLRSLYKLAREIKNARKRRNLPTEYSVAKAKRKRKRLQSRFIRNDHSCPLCNVNGNNCGRCPWVLFEKATCLKMKYFEDGFTNRIHRMDRWEKRLLEMRRRHE